MDAMEPAPSPPPQRILVRKYRNRRYYDTTRSLHITLEAICQLIHDGHDVQVTDVQSGEDITAKVLAQIILEQEPGKLGVFPTELLHRVIRANEPLIREFVDRYFNQFLRAYVESQRESDRYLRQAMGLEFPVSAAGDWFRTMMWPLRPAAAARGGASAAGPPPPPPAAAPEAASQVADLQKQIQDLQKQVEKLGRRRRKSPLPPDGG